MCVIVLLASWLSFGRQSVLAQDETPEDYRSWATYEFGKEMVFNLEATVADQVSELTLFLQTNGSGNTLATQVQFENGGSLRASHSLDLTQLLIAPFSQVVYWWEFEGVSGQKYVIPENTIDYLDDQFQWQVMDGEDVEIYWTGEDEALGKLGRQISEEVLADLQNYLPYRSSAPFRIFIYPQIGDLQSSIRLTGRDWVGAHAHPELGVILVATSNTQTAATDLARDISHEMTHLLMYQIVGDKYDKMPRWLEEGLATNFEPMAANQYQETLQKALDTNTTIDFVELCQAFPAGEAAAVLAYAQSESLVQYIQSEYGEFAPAQMIKAVIDGASCQEVTEKTLEVSLSELNQAWLEANARPSLLERLIESGGIWFLLLLISFLILSLILYGSSRSFNN